jgi:hypothetical protein
LCFPCCACQYNTQSDKAAPCLYCGHNVNHIQKPLKAKGS